jgi:hypothetical protein
MCSRRAASPPNCRYRAAAAHMAQHTIRTTCEAIEAFLPLFNGRAHLIQIEMAIINLSHSAHDSVGLILNASEFVIEQAFDNMRGHVQSGQFVAKVRRKSCSVQSLIPVAISNASLCFGHPLKMVVGLPPTWARLAGKRYVLASITSIRLRTRAAAGPKGNVCSVPFLRWVTTRYCGGPSSSSSMAARGYNADDSTACAAGSSCACARRASACGSQSAGPCGRPQRCRP